MTEKNDQAYRTIGEVAESLDLPQHVLRFWETRFKEIEPVKRAGGRRYYRPRDVELVAAIRHLLYGQGYTIKGVQRLLEEKGARALIDETRGRDAPKGDSAPVVAVAAGGAPGDSARIEPAAPQPPQPPWPPAAEARDAAPDAERRLRTALAEIAECRRLLTIGRR